MPDNLKQSYENLYKAYLKLQQFLLSIFYSLLVTSSISFNTSYVKKLKYMTIKE